MAELFSPLVSGLIPFSYSGILIHIQLSLEKTALSLVNSPFYHWQPSFFILQQYFSYCKSSFSSSQIQVLCGHEIYSLHYKFFPYLAVHVSWLYFTAIFLHIYLLQIIQSCLRLHTVIYQNKTGQFYSSFEIVLIVFCFPEYFCRKYTNSIQTAILIMYNTHIQ